MTSDRPLPSRLAAVAAAVAVTVVLALLPLGLGLVLWSAAVAAAWLYRRQGLDPRADRLVWIAQSGMPGLAVEIGRSVGHGAIGVLCGLLSVLLQASVLAMLFPPRRTTTAVAADMADWDPQAQIGPSGASYVLQLASSPLASAAGPRLIPGIEAGRACWLWPAGWLLPAAADPPEQDPLDRYAVLPGAQAETFGVWLLDLRAEHVYWLADCQLAGWRDGRPWLESRGGGRLLAVDECLAALMPWAVERRGGLMDVAGLLPPAPSVPKVHGAGDDLPRIALVLEWAVDVRHDEDPLAALRLPRFRLWIEDRDTGLTVAADDSQALHWQAAEARLWIRSTAADGGVMAWCWQAATGVYAMPADAGEVQA